jgi:hypothetical protein
MSAEGAGYVAVPAVSFSAPTIAGGTTAIGTAVLAGGQITGITVVDPGSLYDAPPTITIGAPPLGGTQAAATATVSSVGVGSINVTAPGSLYNSAPTITIDAPGGGGTTATASAAVSTAGVASVTITSGGTGYVSATPIPTTMNVTVVTPLGTFGPYALVQGALPVPNAPTVMENGFCWWSIESTLDFPGSSLAAAATGVPFVIWYRADTNMLWFVVGGGTATWACSGEDAPECVGDDGGEAGCVPGTTFFNTEFGMGISMGACTSRPFSQTVSNGLSIEAAESSGTYAMWIFGGATCSDTTATFTFTLSE